MAITHILVQAQGTGASQSVANGQEIVIVNANGSIVDSSTYNLTLDTTKNGGVTVDTNTKKYGSGSMYFADEFRGVTFPYENALLLTGEFSIFGWFRQTDQNNKVVVGSNYPTTNNQIQFNQGGTGGFGIYDGSSWKTVNTGVSPLNTWFHLAITRDATNTVRMFVNGNMHGSASSSSSYNFSEGSIGALGGNYFNGGWVGHIDDFVITNTCLWTNTFTPPGEYV